MKKMSPEAFKNTKIQFVGLRVEKKVITNSNEDYKSVFTSGEDVVLYFRKTSFDWRKDNKNGWYDGYYAVKLHQHEAPCGSGYCMSNYADMEVWFSGGIGDLTHEACGVLITDAFEFGAEDVTNNVFTFSEDGGDEYYPSGHYFVDMDLFKPINDKPLKRETVIFNGDNSRWDLCKRAFRGATILDLTDEDERLKLEEGGELENEIIRDVIFIGDSKVDVELLKSRITEVDSDITVIDFS